MTFNSTIKRKRCKCSPSCKLYPSLGCKGFAYSHLPEGLKEQLGKKVAIQRRNRQNKAALSRRVHKVALSLSGSYGAKNGIKKTDLDKWHEERRAEATGKCHNCGQPSCKLSNKYFKFSNCHILPKAKIRSVALHPLNNVELCFWGNSCHTNMDNKILPMNEMNCWDEIVEKFKILYPLTLPEEHQFIPGVLLDTLNVKTVANQNSPKEATKE